MAKRKRNKQPIKETPPIVVNELMLQTADRSRQDMKDFKMSWIGAESITLPRRTRLYDMYSNLEIDGHLSGIVDKRIKAVLNKALYYQGKDEKRLDEFNDLIESEVFRKVIRKIMESKFWGLSGMEFIPGAKLKFEDIARKHIKPHIKTISTMQNSEEGFSYDGVDNLWIVGEEKDLGLFLKCSPYVIWKRGAMADYSQFIEIFGQPVRIVKYNSHDTATKQELKRTLDESGSSLALMIPKEADFEMMDGKSVNGTGELQDRMRTACNDEMSILILGNTETTSSSKSSGYAQSQTHASQQLEITKDDMKFVRSMLNSTQFKLILKSYGYNTDTGGFSFEKEINLQEVMEQVEILKLIKDEVPIDDDTWYKTAGVEKPDNYVQLIKEKKEGLAKESPLEPQPEEAKAQAKKQKIEPTPEQKKTGPKLNKAQQLAAYLADFFDHAR